MTEHRLRVESGPPPHVGGEPSAGPFEEPANTDAKRSARDTARDVAGDARSQAQNVATQARERAAGEVDRRSTQAGRQLAGHGEALDGVAGELRRQGKDGPARIAEQAAQRAKDAGAYLERTDGQDLAGAARSAARDNPVAAAAVGAAAGFAAGRLVKAALAGDDEQAGEPGAARSENPAAGGGPGLGGAT